MKHSSRTYAYYAKQSRIHEKSSLRGLLLFAFLAGLCLIALGPGVIFWILAGLASLLGLSWCFESFNRRYNERMAASTVIGAPESTAAADLDFGWVTREGDLRYERGITFRGRQVRIQIGDKPRVLQRCRPHADFLVAHVEELAAAFDAFKRGQALALPDWSNEILALEIDGIGFYSWKHPTVAEVSFTEESGGESWTCVLDGLQFKDLAQEN